MNDPLGSGTPPPPPPLCPWHLGAPAFAGPSIVSWPQGEPRSHRPERPSPLSEKNQGRVFLFFYLTPLPAPPRTRQIVHPDLPFFQLGDSLAPSRSFQTRRRGGVSWAAVPRLHKACLVQAPPFSESKPEMVQLRAAHHPHYPTPSGSRTSGVWHQRGGT